jgi:azurin
MEVMKTYFALIALGLSGAFLHADQKITVSGNDLMQFDIKEFTVSAGENVELEFKNIGKMPKIAMGHNLVILNKGVSSMAFGQKVLGMGASATNPLPEASMGDVLAATKLLGPDESDTIQFTAPSEPGKYEYLCTFPGHFAMMRGTMTVK